MSSNAAESEYKVLEFFSDGCAPCKNMQPRVEEILKEKTNIKLVTVDVDKEPDMTREYKVRSIPMLVLLKNNEVVKTLVGFKNPKEIKDFFEVKE
jgi:thioredoxin 1